MTKLKSKPDLDYPVTPHMENKSKRLFAPNIYSLDDYLTCKAHIKAHPLCHLVTSSTQTGVSMTSLPLIVADTSNDQCPILLGHIAKRNPHSAQLTSGLQVVGVFSGPSSYVSPRWFVERLTVPTWSYTNVQIRGELEIVEDHNAIRDILQQSITQFEYDVDQSAGTLKNHWRLEQANKTMVERLLTGIIGLRIKVDSMEGISRQVQDKPISDRHRIAEGLCSASNLNAQQVGECMLKLLESESRNV